MNICLCGAEAGYPHADDCPRPTFRASDATIARWEADRDAIRARRAGTTPAEAERVAARIADAAAFRARLPLTYPAPTGTPGNDAGPCRQS